MKADKAVLPLSIQLETLAVRCVRALDRIRKIWTGRRAMLHLTELSDHELHDIGLTREDLHRVYSVPLFADPTEPLQGLARARTRGRIRPQRRS
ncbi:DUF1127 domain-containing protein [Chelativorans sp. YIM 93263]|uniref:DUF1127 domain-containing protein n=1 Tax=Chelativorans sp. YIM 93263 TaxID=2906648 RepID=UPI002379E5A8|nr:DUF1127 domain-containing protein [Chelativorans sp. YIM 93263]